MNYSYVMGVGDIEELKQKGFTVKEYGKNYGISFEDNKIKIFEDFIC